MQIRSIVLVKKNPSDVWQFLIDPHNSPKWDRSIAKVDVPAGLPLKVGDTVETTAPSGMRQVFRVIALNPPSDLSFQLTISKLFENATLRFLLEAVPEGTRITHEISLDIRSWALFIYPIIAMTYKKALATDLEYLRRGLDEDFSVADMEPRRARTGLRQRIATLSSRQARP